jgi:hypothetical protein
VLQTSCANCLGLDLCVCAHPCVSLLTSPDAPRNRLWMMVILLLTARNVAIVLQFLCHFQQNFTYMGSKSLFFFLRKSGGVAPYLMHLYLNVYSNMSHAIEGPGTRTSVLVKIKLQSVQHIRINLCFIL